MEFKRMNLMQDLRYGTEGDPADRIDVYRIRGPKRKDWVLEFTGYESLNGGFIMAKGLWVFVQTENSEQPLEELSEFWEAQGISVMPQTVIVRTFLAGGHDIKQIWWELGTANF
jgi:hypothetical protein